MITDAVLSKKKLGQFFTENANSAIVNLPDLTELNVPELTRLTPATYITLAIANSKLAKINLPFLEQSPTILLGENLQELNLTNLRYLIFSGDNALGGDYDSINLICNTKIEKLVLPNFYGMNNITTVNNLRILKNNYWLKVFDIGNEFIEEPLNAYYFGWSWLTNSYFLTDIFLRHPYTLPINGSGSDPLSLASSTPFSINSPFHSQAYIFVPNSCLQSYKDANFWGDSATYNNFVAIEDYNDTIKNRFADTLTKSWEEISNDATRYETTGAEKSTILSDGYREGLTKTVYIDGCPTQMILVGINQDYLKNSTTRAAFTWMESSIARFNLINTYSGEKNYNDANYLKTELERIYNTIDIKPYIKEVTKLTKCGATSQQSNDFIWIPAPFEINNSWNVPTYAGIYASSSTYQYFMDQNHRPIYYFGRSGLQPDNANLVALREWENEYNNPYCIKNNGTEFSPAETNNRNHYIIVGFCM